MAAGEAPEVWSSGSFSGARKWGSGTALADGRAVFAPFDASSILIFDPASRSCKEVGSFFGQDKWRGSVMLQDGRVLFAPCSAESILIFDPSDDTWENVGSFPGVWKWCDCVLLADGRVVFVPWNYPSILVFDPREKRCEKVGDFSSSGTCLWGGGCLLSDGRVAFAPYNATCILIFDPADLTWQELGCFDGRGKWQSCATLSDGLVVFAPCSAFFALLLDPTDNSWRKIDGFDDWGDTDGCEALPDGRILFTGGTADKVWIWLYDRTTRWWQHVTVCEFEHENNFPSWSGSTLTCDGRVVLAPFDANSVVVAEHASWRPLARPPQQEQQLLSMVHRLWYERSYADAVVEAGSADGQGSNMLIPVHRAVLAARSDVFATMFAGPFAEAAAAKVVLPEEPAVVKAVLEHIYTGVLPSVDPLQALQLAHRLGLNDCVAASAARIDANDVAHAIKILAPLLGDPAVNAAWARLKVHIQKDPELLESVLKDLALPLRLENRSSEWMSDSVVVKSSGDPFKMCVSNGGDDDDGDRDSRKDTGSSDYSFKRSRRITDDAGISGQALVVEEIAGRGTKRPIHHVTV